LHLYAFNVVQKSPDNTIARRQHLLFAKPIARWTAFF
jgi:hypothetical protein